MTARRLPASLLAFAIVAAAAILPAPTRVARACPDISLPEPLRLLYNRSNRVVVARVGRAAPGKRDEESGTRLMKTPLEVSATLKGEGDSHAVKLLYRVAVDEKEEPTPLLDEGERLLMFLRRSEEGDGYALAGSSAAKKLGDEDLEVYVRRVEELADIHGRGKPDVEQVVEWLVRCAEEPATRWEGAVDILMSVEMARSMAARKEAASVPAHAEPGAAADEGNADGGEAGETVEVPEIDELEYFSAMGVDPEIGAHLTASHKERLAAAHFGAQRMTEGDIALAALVGSWDDPRLVPFLVAHLRGVAQDPPDYAEELMKVVAGELDDDKVRAAVVKFGEAYYAADIVAEAELQTLSGAAGGGASAAGAEEGAVETQAANESQPTEGEAEVKAGGETGVGSGEVELKPDPALVRRRSALLRNFLALVESKAGAASRDEGGRMKDESSAVRVLP